MVGGGVGFAGGGGMKTHVLCVYAGACHNMELPSILQTNNKKHEEKKHTHTHNVHMYAQTKQMNLKICFSTALGHSRVKARH